MGEAHPNCWDIQRTPERADDVQLARALENILWTVPLKASHANLIKEASKRLQAVAGAAPGILTVTLNIETDEAEAKLAKISEAAAKVADAIELVKSAGSDVMSAIEHTKSAIHHVENAVAAKSASPWHPFNWDDVPHSFLWRAPGYQAAVVFRRNDTLGYVGSLGRQVPQEAIDRSEWMRIPE